MLLCDFDTCDFLQLTVYISPVIWTVYKMYKNRKAPATATGAFYYQRPYLSQKGGVTHF